MKRRTLLAGLGSLAVGSGAVLGSGAVTSIGADRAVAVEVVGDGSSFLQIPSTASTDFVDMDGNGALRIRLDGSVGNGQGVNLGGGGSPAWTTIDTAFTLTNTSDKTLYVEVEHDAVNHSSGNDVQFIAKDLGGDVLPTSGDKPAFFDRGSTGTSVSDNIGGSGGTTVSAAGGLEMDSGESVDVVFQVVSGSGASIPSSPPLLESVTLEAYTSKSSLDYSPVSTN